MRSYKEMDWDELEDCAERIRHEIEIFTAEAELWESRDASPTPAFYSRIEELKEELDLIASFQKVFGDN